MFAEHASDGRPNQLPRNGVRALQLAFILELEFAGDGRKRRINIRHPRHRVLLPNARRALLGVAHDAFQRRDRQALADT